MWTKLIFISETLMKLNDDQTTRLKNAAYKTADPLVMVDLLVDLMFIVDILINFRYANPVHSYSCPSHSGRGG